VIPFLSDILPTWSCSGAGQVQWLHKNSNLSAWKSIGLPSTCKSQ